MCTASFFCIDNGGNNNDNDNLWDNWKDSSCRLRPLVTVNAS